MHTPLSKVLPQKSNILKKHFFQRLHIDLILTEIQNIDGVDM